MQILPITRFAFDGQRKYFRFMRKIDNRQELNSYYSLVDVKLKQYIDEHRVRPSELLEYVKNNLTELKEETGLQDIFGIDRVFLDVAQHYNHSQLDKVLRFEGFVTRYR